MFNKKKIFGMLMAIMLSAGISFGNNNCEAHAQRWERLLSSTIDILLDRDIEPPYMRGYASVEPRSAIFMPPRMERRMGILGALAEFVEMLPPPLPPEPTVVVVKHHRPLPRHLRPLRKFEHFHHPVRNVHRPLIVGKHVVPHVIKRKDFVEYRKHKHHGPVAPIVVKDKFHKGPVDPRKLEQKREISKHKSERNGRIEKHGKGGIRPVSHNEKINKKNAALNRQKNIKTRISNKKITKRLVVSRKQTIKKPFIKKPAYSKPSTSYRRSQPKPQYRKKSSSSSRKPVYQNNPYLMRKRGK